MYVLTYYRYQDIGLRSTRGKRTALIEVRFRNTGFRSFVAYLPTLSAYLCAEQSFTAG